MKNVRWILLRFCCKSGPYRGSIVYIDHDHYNTWRSLEQYSAWCSVDDLLLRNLASVTRTAKCTSSVPVSVIMPKCPISHTSDTCCTCTPAFILSDLEMTWLPWRLGVATGDGAVKSPQLEVWSSFSLHVIMQACFGAKLLILIDFLYKHALHYSKWIKWLPPVDFW